LFDNIKVNARDQVIMVSVIEDSANPGQYIPVTGSEFVGTAVDNNGNFIEATESMVSGWVFEETSAGSKDLEGAGAKMEKMETSSVKEMLSSYGFSVERTERLSSLLISYKKISSKRALNTFEKDMFTKELTGLTFEAASKELVNNYEGLIEKAAERNGIDPEAVKEVILQVL
jgi:hypothetical protein